MRSIAVTWLSVLLAAHAVLAFGRDLDDPATPFRRNILSEGGEFNYQKAGSDWPEAFPACGGLQQSPINVSSTDAEVHFKDLTARLGSFGKGREVTVKNTGHSVQVGWKQADSPTVFLPVVDGVVSGSIDPLDHDHDETLDVSENGTGAPLLKYALVAPQQFHFHINSENAIDGRLFPMEGHLVTKISKEEVNACGDEGCVVVFAVLYELSLDDNEFLEPFLESAPTQAGDEHEGKFPEFFTVDFDDMLPDKKTYYTWQGSFTTPPCTEGVTWILFDNYQPVSTRQITLLQQKMAAVRNSCMKTAEEEKNFDKVKQCMNIGDLKNNRELQPLHRRLVSHVVDPPASS